MWSRADANSAPDRLPATPTRTFHQGLLSILTISAITLPVAAHRSPDVRISTSPAGGQRLGLAAAIDEKPHLLKVHLP